MKKKTETMSEEVERLRAEVAMLEADLKDMEAQRDAAWASARRWREAAGHVLRGEPPIPGDAMFAPAARGDAVIGYAVAEVGSGEVAVLVGHASAPTTRIEEARERRSPRVPGVEPRHTRRREPDPDGEP